MKFMTALIASVLMSLTAFAETNEQLVSRAFDLVELTVLQNSNTFSMLDFKRSNSKTIVVVGYEEDGASCSKEVEFNLDTQGLESATITNQKCIL